MGRARSYAGKGKDDQQMLFTSLTASDIVPISALSLASFYVQGSKIRLWTGFVNFVAALAYHFCLRLPAAFR